MKKKLQGLTEGLANVLPFIFIWAIAYLTVHVIYAIVVLM